MTSRERRTLPPVVSLLFALAVVGLAVMVVLGVAAAAGVSPLGPGGTSVPGTVAGSPAAAGAAASAASLPGPTSNAAPAVERAVSPAASSSPASGSPASGSPAAARSGPPSTSSAASAGPSAASSSAVSTVPPATSPVRVLDPRPTAGPFSMDLYRRGDFVSEMNKVSCVPAAMQTMINIMTPGADTTVATQKRLYALARKLSPKTLKGDGAEPEGWARGLTQLGFGPYVVDVEPTRTLAIKAAARALRLTGLPVGILAWRGAHSWVMSGFTATADPAFTDRFTVTAVNIEDVWYPRISSIWGPSRRPDALVPVALLPEDILPWHRPTGPYLGKDGKYVLVQPVVATG